MKRRTFLETGAASGTLAAAGMLKPQTVRAAVGYSGDRHPYVAIAASDEKILPNPAPMDSELSYEQVRDVVWLALERDVSDRRLVNIVTPESWVVIKPNIVTIPLSQDDFGQGRGPSWNLVPEDDEGVMDHWGLVTDLRVIKAVAEYLIDRIGPRRITIAEGGVWYSSGGKLKPEKFLDGWHVDWEGFGGLSYAGICEELDGKNGVQVDIVDLNEDEPVYVTDYDPYRTGHGAFQYVPADDEDATSNNAPTPRKGMWFPRTIMERDILITCPVLKTHGSVGTTLFMKNFVGCVHSQKYVGGNHKVPIHKGTQYNLARGVADLACAINPDYGVAEGFWATMNMHNGQNGVNIHHNVVICGADIVAAESVANMAMGFNPLDFDHLRMCSMKKLGQWQPDRIRIIGPPVDSIKVNYARAANKYVARGVRKWLWAGPLRKPLDEPSLLEPRLGDVLGDDSWKFLDGDAVMDSLPFVSGSSAYKDNLRYPLPGSEGARKGSVYYLSMAVLTDRVDLVGQLLVGVEGASFLLFVNGAERTYNADPFRYDPTPSPFCKFHSGANRVLIELTKTVGRNEPVKIAFNVCDLDGDRLADMTFEPPGE